MNKSVTVEILGQDIHILITSYIPGRPAQIVGPPENCYPEEPPEIEWELDDEENTDFILLTSEHLPSVNRMIDDYLYENINSIMEYI